MERIDAEELRQDPDRYLARVQGGETLEIAERGRLVALLVPPTPAQLTREGLIADGRLVPASAPWKLPTRVQASTRSEDVLDDLRSERLCPDPPAPP